MSIIQEALKKAQTTYARKTYGFEKNPSSQKIAEEKPSQKPDSRDDFAALKPQGAGIHFTKLIPAVILLTLIAGFGLNSFFSKDTAEAPKDKPHQNVSYKPAVKDAALKDPPDTGFGIRAEDIASPIKSAISSGGAFVRAPDLELNGIMYLQERPRAIINGNIVEVGESVSGARINAINRNSVLLNYNDLEITLKLKE